LDRRLLRSLQLLVLPFILVVTAALFGGVEIVGQTPLVIAGALLLVVNLILVEGDTSLVRRGRTVGPVWLALLAATVGIVLLQLVPLPEFARKILAPGGTKWETSVRIPEKGPVTHWSDLFPEGRLETGGSVLTTEDLWRGLDQPLPASGGGATRPGDSDKEGRPDQASEPSPDRWRPLSTVPGATLASLGLLLAYAGFFWATVSTFRDEKMGALLLDSMIGVAFVFAILGLVQDASGVKAYYGLRPFGPGANPYGPFANRNHFATFVGSAIPIAVFRSLHRFRQARQHHRRKTEETANDWALAATWGFVAVILSVALVRSASRGGILTVAIGLGLSLLVFLRRRRPGLRTLILGAIAVTVLLALAIPLLKGRTEVLARRGEESVADAGGLRFGLMKAAFHQWLDHPVFGSGLGSFPWTSQIHKPPTGAATMEKAHNDYAEWFAETGLAGGVVAVGALVLLWRELLRAIARCRRRYWYALVGVFGGVASVLLHELFDFGLQVPAIAAQLAILAGVIVGLERAAYRAPGRYEEDESLPEEAPLEEGRA
jgi:O-antigen ligase